MAGDGYLLAYLLLTSWIFYWHELPLLGMVVVIPWSLTILVAVVLSITLVPMLPGVRAVVTAEPSATRQLANTTIGRPGRYGGALVALAIGLRGRRRAASSADPP